MLTERFKSMFRASAALPSAKPARESSQERENVTLRQSRALEQFFSYINDQVGLSILDLAGATQENVSFVTDLYTQDFLRSLDDTFGPDGVQEQTNARLIDSFLEQNLDFKENTFDGVLIWDVMQYLSEQARSRELEQIGHEDDGLRVLQAFEAEGWMKVLYAPWTPAKADEEKLKVLHDLTVELLMQGVHADISAAQMQLLTAKMAPKDLSALKKLFLRPGFVEEWNSLDTIATGFAKVLLSKENQTPSATYKLFTTYDPEAVL